MYSTPVYSKPKYFKYKVNFKKLWLLTLRAEFTKVRWVVLGILVVLAADC